MNMNVVRKLSVGQRKNPEEAKKMLLSLVSDTCLGVKYGWYE